MRTRTRWSKEETERAARLYTLGYSHARVGEMLGRSQDAVQYRIKKVGLGSLPRKKGRRPTPRRHVTPDTERNPWHPARDPIPARYDWFYGYGKSQTAV